MKNVWEPGVNYSTGATVAIGSFTATCKAGHTSGADSRQFSYWRIWEMTEAMSRSVMITFFNGLLLGAAYQNEAMLKKLLVAFDEQIDAEKGARDEHREGLGDLTDISAARIESFDNGRVDGVDTGRALVEEVMGDDDAASE